MSGLDIFALIVLITLIVCFLALWAVLGMFPGRIARQRNHPQAEAINVCGWWGAITMGVLSPIAFIWAYTNSEATLTGKELPSISDQDQAEDGQDGEEQS